MSAKLVLGLAAALIVAVAAGSWVLRGNMSADARVANETTERLRIPEVPPLLLRDVDPATAIETNRLLAFSKEPNPPSKSFRTKGDDVAYLRALHCLTSAIYYEAASETADGQRAVAQVVLNRVRHPAFPKSLCGVTYQGSRRSTGCQFSFTCDGSLLRKPNAIVWDRARAIAAAALEGAVFAPVGHATHYHANYVVPYWAPTLAKNAVVGTHIFYRWPGWWGQAAAFRGEHSGQEPDPRILRHYALGLSGKPQLDDPLVEVDPRVELISIIDLLAAPARADGEASDYEKKVREHFSGHTNHVAVEIYRQLQASERPFKLETALDALMHYSAPPDLAARGIVAPDLIKAAGGPEVLDGFIAALNDFVLHSKFEEFFAEQRTYYAENSRARGTVATEMVAKLERQTQTRITNVRFLLAPSLQDIGSSGCRPSVADTSERWMLIPADRREKPQVAITELSETLDKLSKQACKVERAKAIREPPSTQAGLKA